LESYRWGAYQIMDGFIRYVSATTPGGDRLGELEDLDQALLKEIGDTIFKPARAALLEDMAANPFVDLLGPWYMLYGSRSAKQARGEFYTPVEICDLMAMMTIGDADQAVRGRSSSHPLTLCEPACGSGQNMLSACKVLRNHLDKILVTSIDINPLAVDMAYFNYSFWNIPAFVIQGDAIRMQFSKCYRTPAVEAMLAGEPAPESHLASALSPEPVTHTPSPAMLSQLEMNFGHLAEAA
jgi:hypothetical protein